MRQTQQPLVLPDRPHGRGRGKHSDRRGQRDGDGRAAPPPIMASGPSVTDIYNQARIDYTQGRYALAVSGFRGRSSRRTKKATSPTTPTIGLARATSRSGNTSVPSNRSTPVIRDYPDSNKRSDAYLKRRRWRYERFGQALRSTFDVRARHRAIPANASTSGSPALGSKRSCVRCRRKDKKIGQVGATKSRLYIGEKSSATMLILNRITYIPSRMVPRRKS